MSSIQIAIYNVPFYFVPNEEDFKQKEGTAYVLGNNDEAKTVKTLCAFSRHARKYIFAFEIWINSSFKVLHRIGKNIIV